jgi:hypothetical protein
MPGASTTELRFASVPTSRMPGSNRISDAPVRCMGLAVSIAPHGQLRFSTFRGRLRAPAATPPQSVFENSSCKPVTARCTTIPPCYGPTLPLLCDRLVPIPPSARQRPPTRISQRRRRLCRARPCMLAPSIPVTSRMPHGRCWHRCCRRQRGAAGPAPGRCGCSSTRSSTSCVPAVPSVISHASIRPGNRPIRPSANGACTGSGSASMRRCAARFASGRDATLTPRRP